MGALDSPQTFSSTILDPSLLMFSWSHCLAADCVAAMLTGSKRGCERTAVCKGPKGLPKDFLTPFASTRDFDHKLPTF